MGAAFAAQGGWSCHKPLSARAKPGRLSGADKKQLSRIQGMPQSKAGHGLLHMRCLGGKISHRNPQFATMRPCALPD